jgi:hypothetical protein
VLHIGKALQEDTQQHALRPALPGNAASHG